MSRSTTSDGERSHLALDRRSFLATGGTLAAAAAAGVGFAGEAEAAPLGAAASKKLAASSLACVSAGKTCIEHSIAALKAGDHTLSSCASRVQEMVLSCGALSRLAINGSPQAGAMTSAVREVASECERQCRRFADHQPFRACAESCADFVRHCDAVAYSDAVA